MKVSSMSVDAIENQRDRFEQVIVRVQPSLGLATFVPVTRHFVPGYSQSRLSALVRAARRSKEAH
jgi:hypothetical protein